MVSTNIATDFMAVKGNGHDDDGGGTASSAASPASLAASPAALAVRTQSRTDMNSKAKIAKDRLSKVPRPPNAFILYRQDKHPAVKMSHPGIKNNEISVIIGNMWKGESDQVKEAYKAKAEAVKNQHSADHPGYQYQPRKPSEKKRRMTKHKADESDAGQSQADSPSSDIHAEENDFVPVTVEPLPKVPRIHMSTDGMHLTFDFDHMHPELLLESVQQFQNEFHTAYSNAWMAFNPSIADFESQLMRSGMDVDTMEQHQSQIAQAAEFATMPNTLFAQPHQALEVLPMNSFGGFDSLNEFHQNWINNAASQLQRFNNLDAEFAPQVSMHNTVAQGNHLSQFSVYQTNDGQPMLHNNQVIDNSAINAAAAGFFVDPSAVYWTGHHDRSMNGNY